MPVGGGFGILQGWHGQGMYYAWRDEKCMLNFGQKTWREETTWKI